jgi:hypothetical protein
MGTLGSAVPDSSHLLYVAGTHGIAYANTLRELRRSIGLKQQEFALLLQVALATLRKGIADVELFRRVSSPKGARSCRQTSPDGAAFP